MATAAEWHIEEAKSEYQNHNSNNNVNNTKQSAVLPHGLGLLTTVASLPPKYRSRYLSITTIKSEKPLDLSVKPISPQIVNDVPIATSFTEVYTEPFDETQTTATTMTTMTTSNLENEKSQISTIATTIETKIDEQIVDQPTMMTVDALDLNKSPITPPPTPTKRKLNEKSSKNDGGIGNGNGNGNSIEPDFSDEQFIADNYANPVKIAKTNENPTRKIRDSTPIRPIKSNEAASAPAPASKTIKSQIPATKPAKNKATRKLKFDEETSSPVSGTIIRPLEDITDGLIQYSNGDIDPKYNIVEITEETKAELAAIKNVIGDYICKLCRLKFDDAFGLAQHRCACIVLLEYRCPECGKQFNCPANLASHRRWHKPKKDSTTVAVVCAASASAAKKENRNTINTVTQQRNANNISTSTSVTYACEECGKGFKRQAYLRKHQLTHANGDGGTVTNVNGKKSVSVDFNLSKMDNQKTTRATLTQTGTRGTTVPNSCGLNKMTYPNYSVAAPSSISTSTSTSSSSSSSSSSVHSYVSGVSMAHEDEVGVVTYMVNGKINSNSNSNSANVAYDYDIDSMSECSNSSTGCGRLQIVESGLTEEENIAAAALTNLRNCASVIQHTTLAH